MSLDLHVDRAAWRRGLASTVASTPGLVPVIKGNGYGFGNQVLLDEAALLGAGTVAVGTPADLAALDPRAYPGEVLVLVPWCADQPPVPAAWSGRVVQTVGHVEDLAGLAGQPVVVELMTSMRRHGIGPAEISRLAAALAGGTGPDVRGFGLHLPLPGFGGGPTEVDTALDALGAAGIEVGTLFGSHLSPAALTDLAGRHPGVTLRPRIGTSLWLGDRSVRRATATVLDVRAIGRGDRYGYRGRRALSAGHLVVVSGGTAHGIATEPPGHTGTLRRRLTSLASGGLEAAGFAPSPFTITGSRRWFAEPPHMQVSMLMLPAKAAVPDVGDEVAVNVGMTLTRFDRTVWE